jgi:hypothetical protein
MAGTRKPSALPGRPPRESRARGDGRLAPAARSLQRRARTIVGLQPGRLGRVKFAYTTRRVERGTISTLLPAENRLKTGDLLLARVESLGQHDRIELPDGRRATLFVGDEIAVTFGTRYAPDQFEGIVPGVLTPCHLVAAGGIAARMLEKHSRMRNPTEIVPVGLLGDASGDRINLSSTGLPRLHPDPDLPHPPVVVVAGSSMNSGKTTVLTSLARGLVSLGLRVATAKLTGTGAGGDRWRMVDAGADPALDFVDAGYASTYLLPPDEVDELVAVQMAHLFRSQADIVLVEISDGILMPESARLLVSPAFRVLVDGVLFTAVDSLSAAFGVAWFRQRELPLLAVSGVLTSSPLAMREAVRAAEIQLYPSESFAHPEVAAAIRQSVTARTGPHRRRPARENAPPAAVS